MSDVARLFTRTCVNIRMKLASHRLLYCIVCVFFMEQKFIGTVNRDTLYDLWHGPGERQCVTSVTSKNLQYT